MSILSILTPPTLTPSAQENGTADPSNTDASDAAQGTGQSEDTAPPAPVSGGNDSADTTGTGSGTDPATQGGSSAQATSDGPQFSGALATPVAPDTSSTRTAVEASLNKAPDLSEEDARRFAEAAQAKQRLEMLIEAVQTPVEVTPLVAPAAAAQAEAGPTETDGTPV